MEFGRLGRTQAGMGLHVDRGPLGEEHGGIGDPQLVLVGLPGGAYSSAVLKIFGEQSPGSIGPQGIGAGGRALGRISSSLGAGS